MSRIWLLAITLSLSMPVHQAAAEESPPGRGELGSAANTGRSGFKWVDLNGEKMRLRENGQTVFEFQLAPKSQDGNFARANYVHPLFDTSGAVVTEDFPKDHLHQRGVFWAWHQLKRGDTALADPWVCRDIQWLEPQGPGPWVTTDVIEGEAKLVVVRDWAVPDPKDGTQLLRVVRETAGISVPRSRERIRMLDFDLRFRSLVEGIVIGGSEDAKGYGGFSPRIRLSDDVQFVGRHGLVTPQRLAAVEAGPWVDVQRTLDGERKGVAIMVHPSHPDSPLKWILRAKGSMQNPRWPGQHAVALSTKEETRLRYRLVLHSGDIASEKLDAIWRAWSRED